MQPESLSRTLRALAETGLIDVERCHSRPKNTLIERYMKANGCPGGPRRYQ